jgi:hypothetical protein
MKYRKVDPRIWNDAKFMALSDDGKLAFFMKLTHPHMTAVGAMRATIPGLASELSWKEARYREAIKPALETGMVIINEPAAFVWLPNFLRYNAPSGPNEVRKAWPAALQLLPECHERHQLAAKCVAIFDGLSDGMKDAIGDGIRDAMSDLARATREPEPEQEPEKEKKRAAPSAPAPLPDWLPPEWHEFERHRTEKRSKLTPTARRGAIAKLARWRAEGHDVVAILRNSIDNGYSGLFLPTEKTQTGSPVEKSTEWWQSAEGLRAKALELGVDHADDPQRTGSENFLWLKAKVCAAAGEGPWNNDRSDTFQRLLARARQFQNAEGRLVA